MAKRDFYSVLGVARNSSDEDIKKAYRKMAMKYHPDRLAGESDREAKKAEEKFKEGKEAYEILSDPQKRAAYDQYGHAASDDSGLDPFSDTFGGGTTGSFDEDYGDIFGNIFGDAARSKGKGAGTKNAFKEAGRDNSPKFNTSLELKTYAETGQNAEYNLRKDYAQSVADAINANPALLDATSAPAVATLLEKIPAYDTAHKALRESLKTHGKGTITDDTFVGISIQGATLYVCAKFLTSKTLKTYAETGQNAEYNLRKDYAQSVADAINANPALLDATSAPAVATLLEKIPAYDTAHKALRESLKTHGKGTITDDTFVGISIQGATLYICAKFLTSKTLKTYAETGQNAEYNLRKDYAQSAANAINANPALLDATSAPAVATLLEKIPAYDTAHKALRESLKTHGKGTITDDTFVGISIQGATLYICAKFLTSKTLKTYAETGQNAEYNLRKDYAQSAANAINANPALLDATSAPAVAILLSKIPDYESAHKALKTVLSKYQSQQSQIEPNVLQPHAFGS